MKTRTVAYATQMLSSTAVIRGDLYHWSVLNVRSAICALVLVTGTGTSGACVILSVLAAFESKRSATHRNGQSPRGPWRVCQKTYCRRQPNCSDAALIASVTLATLRLPRGSEGS